MLEVKGINTHYGNIHALKGIDLEVKQGEIVTLIGSNGAGKSTTMATITGLLKATSGEVWFKGENITNIAPSEIVKKGISLSPEGREVFPALSVEENLKLGAFTRTNKKEINDSYDRVYDLFPRLLERKKQIAGTLSGGEQQMLAIGRALMSMPQLLILDEPSLGLAPNLVLLIFDLIESINKQGVTVLLVEQNANMALSIADRGYVLETGKVTMTDDAQILCNNEAVRKAYLGSV
ncbi:ABC transporter ATP-binding protein [Vallitalea maricola]|uniref:ABC transporter ATP-binding protein n=1 Tax=Vallitalea maricola TaxID=3074433 RepID=A0ACB5UKW0_9FIRM|nr:ABC transporter ATP-binding protein [Vallitalea sp. AN17-2]